MYRILGGDGREYGPATGEQLRGWIAQGRANAATQVLAEGATEWKPLGTLPEFALLFTTVAPGSTPAVLSGAPIRKVHPLATTGLILGIISVTVGLCCCYGFPMNLAGLTLSLIALLKIRDYPERFQGRGIAIAGLVLSIIGLLLMFTLILIFGLMSSMETFNHGLEKL
jgi:hypothetical protein